MLHKKASFFQDSQTCNCSGERVNKDEILISKGDKTKCATCMQNGCLAEVTKCVRGHHRLHSPSHGRHQGHHRNSTQCSSVSAASVIMDDNSHPRRERRKWQGDTYTQQMNLFALYHSNGGSYTVYTSSSPLSDSADFSEEIGSFVRTVQEGYS